MQNASEAPSVEFGSRKRVKKSEPAVCISSQTLAKVINPGIAKCHRRTLQSTKHE
jgi:hypothetical protein